MARPMVSVVAQLFTVTVTGFHDASGECCGQLNLECVGGLASRGPHMPLDTHRSTQLPEDFPPCNWQASMVGGGPGGG
jgi:hypothetical protein